MDVGASGELLGWETNLGSASLCDLVLVPEEEISKFYSSAQLPALSSPYVSTFYPSISLYLDQN